MGNEPLAVTQDLGRLAPVIAHIAAVAHHRMDEEIPSRRHDFFRRRQPMAHEGAKGVLGRRFRNSGTEQKACQEPVEVRRVGSLR